MSHRPLTDDVADLPDAWPSAGGIAGQWLRRDKSSLEAASLTRYARRLLQAIISELGLASSSRTTAIKQCRDFLESETSAPGSVAARLRLSGDPRVLLNVQDVETYGRSWVATIGPSRNLVVMTALLNLQAESG